MNLCKHWREQMGFRSQTQAAEALGYSQAMVKKWESGDYPVPYHVRLAMTALFHRLEPWSAE